MHTIEAVLAMPEAERAEALAGLGADGLAGLQATISGIQAKNANAAALANGKSVVADILSCKEALAGLEGGYCWNPDGDPILADGEPTGELYQPDADAARELITLLRRGLPKGERKTSSNAKSDYNPANYTLAGTLLTVTAHDETRTWSVPPDMDGRKKVAKEVRKYLAAKGCEVNNRVYKLRQELGVNGNGR